MASEDAALRGSTGTFGTLPFPEQHELMNPSEPAYVSCPYCAELLEIVIDASAGRQEYIEDCQVCCKPITFRIRLGAEGEPRIEVRGENE